MESSQDVPSDVGELESYPIEIVAGVVGGMLADDVDRDFGPLAVLAWQFEGEMEGTVGIKELVAYHEHPVQRDIDDVADELIGHGVEEA
jgi:hypothetical protein